MNMVGDLLLHANQNEMALLFSPNGPEGVVQNLRPLHVTVKLLPSILLNLGFAPEQVESAVETLLAQRAIRDLSIDAVRLHALWLL
jgi:hypothetical protein